jgi:hypothetical protein
VRASAPDLQTLPESPPPPKPKRKKPKRDAARVEARSRGRERRQAARLKLFESLKNLPDDAVLLIPEWAALNTFSEREARRILASGKGPVVTQLSPKRRGITVRHNREWQERRALMR